MIAKIATASLGGYVTYRVFTTDQQKSDFKGISSGFLNTFGAVYVVGMAVLDYKYTLRNLEYNTKDYFKERSIVHDRVAKKILALSLKNRGVYLKAGQYIGNLERIMPKEYTEALKVLQDSGPSVPYDEIKIVIEHDLGQKCEEIFSTFNRTTIAAASLAQVIIKTILKKVHEATLKENGQRVAVKIQFPSLRTQYKYDLLVVGYISRFCDFYIKISGSEELKLADIFTTFSEALKRELDFVREQKNGIKTKKLFMDFPQIYIPQYFEKYGSSRVLVMDFVEGVKINDVEAIKKVGLKPTDCAQLLIDIFGRMIFSFGHVHCDAHPGNILVRPWNVDPTKPQVVLLDHGFYSEIDEITLDLFRRMWISLAKFDYVQTTKYARLLGMEDSHIEYLPLIFFYRTITSTKRLGESFQKEERTYVRGKELATLESVSRLLRSMPPELLFVIRASNLVGIHNALLGGTTRYRLKSFTRLAMKSTYTNIIQFHFNYSLLRVRLFIFEYFHRLYRLAF